MEQKRDLTQTTDMEKWVLSIDVEINIIGPVLNYNIMKKLLLLLSLIVTLFSCNDTNQKNVKKTETSKLTVKEGSFKYNPNVLIVNKSEYMDDNFMPMALIRISTENINESDISKLTFNSRLDTQIRKEYVSGYISIYITANTASYIEIRHPEYGYYKYNFPEKLRDFCVYDMILQNNIY